MKRLLTLLDAARLAYHTAHHYTRSAVYFGDHEFFNDGYLAAQADFDALFERTDFLGMDFDQDAISKDATGLVNIRQDAKSDALLATLQSLEKAIIGSIERLKSDCSHGTNTLLGDIASRSEARAGHIKRRLMPS